MVRRLSGYEPRSEISASYGREGRSASSSPHGPVSSPTNWGLLQRHPGFSEETAVRRWCPWPTSSFSPAGATPADVERVAHTGSALPDCGRGTVPSPAYVHLKDVLYASGEEHAADAP